MLPSLRSEHEQRTILCDDKRELDRRVAKLVPFAVFPGEADPGVCECWVIEKTASREKSYMYDKVKVNRFLGTVSKLSISGDMFICDRNNYCKFCLSRYITLHKWQFHGFFKPDLYEVASQLPKTIFDDFDEIFVTTEPWSDKIDELMRHETGVHIGVTTVFVTTTNQQSTSSCKTASK